VYIVKNIITQLLSKWRHITFSINNENEASETRTGRRLSRIS